MSTFIPSEPADIKGAFKIDSRWSVTTDTLYSHIYSYTIARMSIVSFRMRKSHPLWRPMTSEVMTVGSVSADNISIT